MEAACFLQTQAEEEDFSPSSGGDNFDRQEETILI